MQKNVKKDIINFVRLLIRLASCTAGNGYIQFCYCWQGVDKCMK